MIEVQPLGTNDRRDIVANNLSDDNNSSLSSAFVCVGDEVDSFDENTLRYFGRVCLLLLLLCCFSLSSLLLFSSIIFSLHLSPDVGVAIVLQYRLPHSDTTYGHNLESLAPSYGKRVFPTPLSCSLCCRYFHFFKPLEWISFDP